MPLVIQGLIGFWAFTFIFTQVKQSLDRSVKVIHASECLNHIEDCNNINNLVKKNKSLKSNLKILSLERISLTTGTCDNIWHENKIFIESKMVLLALTLKPFMIIPGLLLQKASLNWKSNENSEKLKERLLLWKNEQDILQNNERATANKNKELLTFSWLIEEGKVVNKAIKIFQKTNKGRILSLSDETFEVL